jgi:hypothetical protein
VRQYVIRASDVHDANYLLMLLGNFPHFLLDANIRKLALRCVLRLADTGYETDDIGVYRRRTRIDHTTVLNKLATLHIDATQDDYVKLPKDPKTPVRGVMMGLKHLAEDGFVALVSPILQQMVHTPGFGDSLVTILNRYSALRPVVLQAMLKGRLDLKKVPYNQAFTSALGLSGYSGDRAFSCVAYAVDPTKGLESFPNRGRYSHSFGGKVVFL